MTPREIEFEGNNGGSFIRVEETKTEGIVSLEVGETCVVTVRQEIGVAALAQILTWAKDYGFQKILDDYQSNLNGSPTVRLDGSIKG